METEAAGFVATTGEVVVDRDGHNLSSMKSWKSIKDEEAGGDFPFKQNRNQSFDETHLTLIPPKWNTRYVALSPQYSEEAENSK